jgi:prepilin-type N-terminal cleavage/methylation domain-containing protein
LNCQNQIKSARKREEESKGMQTSHAFTLIELLIVVAIIAILAAIAVPNFLEAQTRSKVSRTLADYRSCRLALESYRVDNTAYPNDIIPPGSFSMYRDTYILFSVMTTPIAYLSQSPKAVFGPWAILNGTTSLIPPGKKIEGFLYATSKHFQFSVLPPFNTSGSGVYQWQLSTQGPVADYNLAIVNGPIPYDPSNGTISRGRIVWYGP